MELVDWRNSLDEPVLDANQRIIDPHHHMWETTHLSSAGRYSIDDLRADLDLGHNIVGTVYVDAYENYAADGPEEFRPVAETAFANSVADRAEALGFKTRVCAGIVSNIKLDHPNVGKVLDAHLEAAPHRLRGCRHMSIWKPDSREALEGRRRVYDDPTARAGMRELAARGLSFDAYTFHIEIPQVTRLAREFGETSIILNHLGSPLGVGPYQGRRETAWVEWRPLIEDLASCPNVTIKLGGQGMPLGGFGWLGRDRPASSLEVAAALDDKFRYAIDLFGPERCMFESNFPVDGLSVGYSTLWNAFKIIAQKYNQEERNALFFDTANRTYRLSL